jgi:methionyl-tRNA synthetase
VVEEQNYFFRLSRYGSRLAQLIDSGSLRILPESRRNEVRALIERGLQDFSISRSRARARGWGIPVPNDPGQVIYVWFDALANYINALDYGARGDLFGRYWASSDERLHTLGKGILRFHALYWPAILLSAELPLPTTLFVHGYLTVDGQKISKSRGNAIDPFELIEHFGLDVVRYWLLRSVPSTGDADFSLARLQDAYTADLARDLGNLVHRVVSLLQRYANGRVPEGGGSPDLACDLSRRLDRALGTDLDPRAALTAVWEVVARANRYADQAAPWREPDTRARGAALYTLAEAVRVVGEALRPLLPGTAARILEFLGTLPTESWLPGLAWGQLVPGTLVQPPRPLFPRLESGGVRLDQAQGAGNLVRATR